MALKRLLVAGPDDELWRDRPVPTVLLRPERDVVATDPPVAVELRALPEGDRAAGVAAVAVHAEAQMLAFSDRDEIAELAAGRKQRHVRIAEPERGQPPQLLAEVERQLRTARQHGVDRCRRFEIV